MENDAVLEEATESEVGFSSFTESIDKICDNDQPERSINVVTTSRTRDPDIIDRARDCVSIFSKVRIPPEQTIKLLNGELQHEYIKTGFQKDGLATIHGMKKALDEKKAKRLFKHIKDIGTMIRCAVYIGEDCVVVTCAEELWAVKNCVVGNRIPKLLSKKLENVLTAILHRNQMEASLQSLVI